eukprot:15591668-Heterocapsa_arctica.AAC.1
MSHLICPRGKQPRLRYATPQRLLSGQGVDEGANDGDAAAGDAQRSELRPGRKRDRRMGGGGAGGEGAA